MLPEKKWELFFFSLAPNITFSMTAQDMANENNTQYFILNEQLQYY